MYKINEKYRETHVRSQKNSLTSDGFKQGVQEECIHKCCLDL